MSGSKTEQPTDKRLKDLRKKGQVSVSKEVVSVSVVVVTLAVLLVSGPRLMDSLKGALAVPASLPDGEFAGTLDASLHAYGLVVISCVAPVLAAAVVTGVAAHVLQFGFMLAPEAAQPKLTRLNPGAYFKKTFGLQNLIEFIKSNVKVIVVGCVVALVVRAGLGSMILAETCGVDCIAAVGADLLRTLVLYVSGPFVVVALADLAYQRWNYTQQNMMTKDEVKREYKESEGDPEVKGRRKQLAREMLAEGAEQQARRASVLVVNPTHVSVAILYQEELTPLPLITAMGVDGLARRMRRAATEAGVPIAENVPLARALLEQGTLDNYIPSELIEPMVEVLRSVRSMREDDRP